MDSASATAGRNLAPSEIPQNFPKVMRSNLTHQRHKAIENGHRNSGENPIQNGGSFHSYLIVCLPEGSTVRPLHRFFRSGFFPVQTW